MAHGFIADEDKLHEAAFDSYRTHQITFESDSGLWRLEPSAHVSGVFPFADPSYLISARHGSGRR